MSWPPNDLPQTILNPTFDETAVGDSASIERTLTLEDIQLFALMSGDMNPQHFARAVYACLEPSAAVRICRAKFAKGGLL